MSMQDMDANKQPMHDEAGTDPTSSTARGERPAFDWLSLGMAAVITAALSWTLWLRIGPGSWPDPPSPGDRAPLLMLKPIDGGEPVVLAGTRGKIVWLVFWSASRGDAGSVLLELAQIQRRFAASQHFQLLAVAIDEDLARARALLKQANLPAEVGVYLAPARTRRAFGAWDLPMHIVIDEQGMVAAVLGGKESGDPRRLGDRVQEWLKPLDPLGGNRFAGGLSPGQVLEILAWSRA